MQKLIRHRATRLGSLLVSKLAGSTLRKISDTTPRTKPPQSVAPTRHGSTYEDLFAADLRAVAAHKQSVLDQIKAVQRDGSKPIKPTTLIGRE